MIGTIIAIIAIAFIQDETLQTIAVILSYVVSLSISSIMEAKGAIGKKIPSFPGPKEPGLMDDLRGWHVPYDLLATGIQRYAGRDVYASPSA